MVQWSVLSSTKITIARWVKAFRFLILPSTLLAVSSGSFGQVGGATVSGVISDQSGAVVPQVEVRVINLDTGVTRSTLSNDSGVYVVPDLKPGHYCLQVGKEGFKKIDVNDMTLNVQDQINRNFTLELGSTSESVSVEGRAESVETSGSVSTVIDRDLVARLPLNGRSFNTLLQLTPGVVIAPSNVSSPGQFSINGQRTNANYFVVDGVSANFGVGVPSPGENPTQGGGTAQAFNAYGGTNSLASVDDVQEFRAITSTFAPEYGHAPGGQVIIETRSGTNAFHGGIFDYFRNTVLDANDWFSNSAGLPRTAEHQNDFGGFFGGPIVRNRTFFFFSYEGLRLIQPQTQVTTVPTMSIRNSAIPQAAVYLNAYPAPNGPVSTTDPNLARFTGAFANRINANATSIRVDEALGSKWTIFGRYNYSPSRVAGRGSSGVLSEVDTSNLDTQTSTVGITGSLTPNLTNSLRLNYSVQTGSVTAGIDNFGGAIPPDSAALLPAPLSNRDSFAGFTMSGVGEYSLGPVYRTRGSQFNLVDGLGFIRGAHQLKFGADYRLVDLKTSGFPAGLVYLVRHQQLSTFASSAQIGPNRLQYQTQSGATMRFPNVGLYAQDSWKIRRRAIMTYGIRWEYDPAPYGINGTKLSAWNNTSNPQNTAIAPIGTAVWNNVYSNFAPRIGIAYSLTPQGDLVIRGGGGIFYDIGTGLAPSLAFNYPNFADNRVSTSVILPVQNVLQYAPTVSFQPPYTGNTFYAFPRDLKVPRSYQWNLALEKSFRGQQSVAVTYVAQTGRNLLRQVLEQDPNANFNPFTEFLLTLNGDTSDYSALQTQYRKTLSHGIQALVNYTWSHCIDTNSDETLPVTTSGLVPPQGDRGNCSFDVRHNFTGAVIYDFPRFTKNRILGGVVNNWSVDVVLQARSGFPISVTYQDFSNPSFPFGITLRPDLVAGVPIWLSESQCIQLPPAGLGEPCPGGKGLNPNAFDSTTPTNQGRQGTLGRNSISGFGATQADISIARKFPFTERINLQLRGDIFNVLNRPNFTNPDGSLTDGSLFGIATQMLNHGLGGLSPLYQIGGPRSAQLSLKLTL